MQKLGGLVDVPKELPATTRRELEAATSEPPCDVCGGFGFVHGAGHELGEPAFGRAVPCDCNAALAAAAGIPPIFADSTFGTYDLARNPETQPWLTACERFALLDGERPVSMLMLHGDPGRGKTHLLVAVIQALRAGGVASVFWEVTELLARLRAAVGEGTVEYEINALASDAFVLALDDIGPENKTGFGEENLYRIINKRWSHEAPTIATCNSRLDDIDPRIRSRFKAGWLYCQGKDMRA